MANPISTRRNKYPELCTFCSPKLHKILLGTAHPLHICQLIVEAVLCFISLLNMVSAVMSRLHNRALFLRKGISLRLSIALFPIFFFICRATVSVYVLLSAKPCLSDSRSISTPLPFELDRHHGKVRLVLDILNVIILLVIVSTGRVVSISVKAFQTCNEAYFSLILRMIFLRVTTQMEAFELSFPVLLFITQYKLALTWE